ncbi:hypothetical protein JN06_01310 [Bacteroides zoogleoformans]|nr:hypothetical protein JN06_01310 [Bacteroides zoogleoformans]
MTTTESLQKRLKKRSKNYAIEIEKTKMPSFRDKETHNIPIYNSF